MSLTSLLTCPVHKHLSDVVMVHLLRWGRLRGRSLLYRSLLLLRHLFLGVFPLPVQRAVCGVGGGGRGALTGVDKVMDDGCGRGLMMGGVACLVIDS